MSKRKNEKDIETRVFNSDWEERFLFTDKNVSKPVCLICGGNVSVPKKYNLERHFTKNHSDFDSKYPIGSVLRTDFIEKKKNSLCGQQLILKKQSNELSSMITASYELSLLLAQKMKPYGDGEQVIKPSLKIFAKQTNVPKISKLVDEIALSRNTVMRRIDEMAEDVNSQIISKLLSCKYFSLALDESCDKKSSAQLCIYIRMVNEYLETSEELLDLRQLRTTTTGEDVFKELKISIEEKNLDWKKLDSVCSDGAPAMIGKNKGCIALLENYLKKTLLKYHCIIHQEALCAKELELSSVLKPVVDCINKIRARALNRRKFREMFERDIEEHGELVLHCDVRWLSRGKSLERFWKLRSDISTYLKETEELPHISPLLEDDEWLWDLAFLCDMTAHLNLLNTRLQGKSNHLPILMSHVASFEAKLALYVTDFSENRLSHFPCMREHACQTEVIPDYGKYKIKVSSLLQSFKTRFADFEGEKCYCDIFINPFAIKDSQLKQYSPTFQSELIDLQNNVVLTSKFAEIITKNESPDYLEFWRFVKKEDFPSLYDLALRYACRFGSTYRCEQSFSKMNLIQDDNRVSLSDSHLKNLLRLASTAESPNIEQLVKKKQLQVPH